jgi:DNA replication protein DnaC
MLAEVTVSKLNEMRLTVMAKQFKDQLENQAYNGMPFEDRFGLLVDTEWSCRKNNRLARLIRRAEFRCPDACLENIEYHTDRGLDKPLITRLSTCGYVHDRRNIIIMGAAGAGKTYMGCAFGNAACRNFFTARYVRLPDLLVEIMASRLEGTYRALMSRLKKTNLLIIDEWLLRPLSREGTNDLLEIIEARHQTASTLFISQFSPHDWHTMLGEDTLADAILDRIVHDSYSILINSKVSMRERKGIDVSEK